MDIRELKVGNNVFFNYKGTTKIPNMRLVAKVEVISDEYISVNVGKGFNVNDIFTARIGDLEPIPLTKDIMKLKGWEDQGSFLTLDVGDLALEWMCEEKKLAVCQKSMIFRILTLNAEFVHELQNVFNILKLFGEAEKY